MFFTHECIRRWFVEMRRLGDWPETAIGKLEADGSIDWKYYDHADYDGIGSIFELLRGAGYDMPEIPETRRSRGYNAWWGFKQLGKPLKTILETEPPWRDYDRNFKGARVVPKGICLSREQTEQIARTAKKKKFFANSYLLYTLDRAISPLLVNEWGARHWMIPVNLRGPVVWERDTANHSSGMWCRIKPGYSPSDVQHALFAQMKTDEHWAVWWRFMWVGVLGNHAVRQALMAGKRRGTYMTGTFVGLGDFSPKKKDGSEPEVLLASPCAMRNSAIAAGAGSFQHRQVLCLSINPAVKDSQLRAEETLERWRQYLLEEM